MMTHQSEQQSENNAQKFFNLFDLGKDGFYDQILYLDGSMGFSVKKNYKTKNNKTTLLSVYVREDVGEELRPIIMHATYGEIVKNGVGVREKYNYSEPVDINSDDEYFYDISKNEILNKKHKKISGNKIVTDFYAQHIKSTRVFLGFWLRVKIFFWRSFLRLVFKCISKLFYFLNYFISGDQYVYEYLFDEIINADKKYSRDGQEGKVDLRKSEKIDFLGYSVKKWPIIAYSFFHIITYVTMAVFGYRPIIITTIFKNSFLTIVYVVFSLWIIEGMFPFMFKFLIRLFSKMSFLSHTKSINV